ncbi:MAG: DUF58 domain-containing protein [Chitinophagaceae bacterium]|nr:MAG: DUF58 domain-containing protein [Chitinophagaceae bacterium]
MAVLPDIQTLLSLRNLSLAARTTVDGFMTGANKSTIKGSGIEFSQYRSYMPGDDLRWMDWKMYARSDRYYIRESETETNITVRLLLDCSASMDHRDGNSSRMDYARYCAACIAYLANRQGDATGLYLLHENSIYAQVPRQGFQNLNRLFYQLEQAGAAGRFTNPVHQQEIHAGSAGRELLVFITDLHQEENEIYQLLDTLAAMRHEIIVLHIAARNELELDYKNADTLEDLETGQTIQVDPSSLKKQYGTKLAASLRETRQEMESRNIYYRLLPMDQPVDEALRVFLEQRSRGH